MMKENEFIVAYDEETGAVWAPEHGELKTTTPEHAKAVEECLQKAVCHELSSQEEHLFEEYMRKSFQDAPKLQVKECPNLLERKTLIRLELMVANDCNLACKYCYANAGTYGKRVQRMSPEQAAEYLHQFIDGRYENVSTVMFFGGEPTLCPDTIEAVCAYFVQAVSDGRLKAVPVYTMVSNATLIDEKMASIIHKYNIHVTVSVDGPKEINDAMRVDKKGQGTFERIEKGIRQIEKTGSRIRLLEATYTVKSKKAGYSRKEIKEYLQQHFSAEDVIVADCEANTKDSSLICTDKEEEFCDSRYDKKIILNRLKCKKFLDLACESGYGSAAMMPNGELYPCHFFVEYPEYCIAAYGKGSFDFSNYGQVLQKLENTHYMKNVSCSDCWAKFTCTRCAADMLLFKSSSCEAIRKKQKETILKCAKEYQKSTF